jgi:arsenate reductase
MTRQPFNVLFLCTGNSARSILAEGILHKGWRRTLQCLFRRKPPQRPGQPPRAETLEAYEYPVWGFRSKSWEEFAAPPDAPGLDFVFTVCDSAAGEACPVWPGQPMTAHWGIEDPAAVVGTDIEKERAFNQAFRYLKNRIAVFIALPVRSLDTLSLVDRL